MIRLINRNRLDLEMPIGDTAILPVMVTNKNTGQSILSIGDRITFTLKKEIGNKQQTILFKEKYLTEDMIDPTKPNILIIPVEFSPEDTLNIPEGYYIYTLQLIRADGNIDTLNGINPYSTFILKGGVNT